MRRAAKVDRNHAEIRDALRRIPGCTVADTARLGDGFPDLVVGFAHQTFLLEVKDGERVPSERRMTADEATFHRLWTGGPCVVVNSVREAFDAIGVG